MDCGLKVSQVADDDALGTDTEFKSIKQEPFELKLEASSDVTNIKQDIEESVKVELETGTESANINQVTTEPLQLVGNIEFGNIKQEDAISINSEYGTDNVDTEELERKFIQISDYDPISAAVSNVEGEVGDESMNVDKPRAVKVIDMNNVFYKCNMCSFYSPQKTFVWQHIVSRHRTVGTYKCTKCPFRTNSKKGIQKHKGVHLQKTFKCDLCNYKGATSSYLRRHKLNHLEDKPFKCDSCSYSCLSNSKLKLHMKIHREKLYKCTMCSYKAHFKSNLVAHVATHMPVKIFRCDQCDFRTAIRRYLKLHKIRHVPDKPFKCSLCDYSTKTMSRLNFHKKGHATEKPYRCSTCSFGTHLKRVFEKHLLRHIPKFHICSECDAKCATAKALKAHKVLHTGVKCSECSYLTSNQSALSNHKRLVHAKPNVMECPFQVVAPSLRQYRCDKWSFADKDINALVTHMKTHLK